MISWKDVLIALVWNKLAGGWGGGGWQEWSPFWMTVNFMSEKVMSLLEYHTISGLGTSDYMFGILVQGSPTVWSFVPTLSGQHHITRDDYVLQRCRW